MRRTIMTLGELESTLKRKDQSLSVYFDFVHFQPEGIHNYRGVYDYGYKDITVADLLKLVSGAIGQTFVGYKGGEYTIDSSTPVYAANHNESGGTGVVDVQDFGWCLILVTEKFDD